MRACAIALVFTLASAAASAQPPSAPALKSLGSSADVAVLVAKAKVDKRPVVVQPLLQLAPYTANIEYRTAVANGAIHEKEAELFYVVDGSGTIVTGGKLTGETRTNADNLSGTGIEGGSVQRIAKGDFILVPENTPHWFSAIDGSLTLMSIHLPRGGSSGAR